MNDLTSYQRDMLFVLQTMQTAAGTQLSKCGRKMKVTLPVTSIQLMAEVTCLRKQRGEADEAKTEADATADLLALISADVGVKLMSTKARSDSNGTTVVFNIRVIRDHRENFKKKMASEGRRRRTAYVTDAEWEEMHAALKAFREKAIDNICNSAADGDGDGL